MRTGYFKNEVELIKERCEEISSSLKDLACYEIGYGKALGNMA